jgi:hypothetical protein
VNCRHRRIPKLKLKWYLYSQRCEHLLVGVVLFYIAVPLNMRYTLDRLDKGFSLLFVPYQINNRYIVICSAVFFVTKAHIQDTNFRRLFNFLEKGIPRVNASKFVSEVV